jgi:hypothetical protein
LSLMMKAMRCTGRSNAQSGRRRDWRRPRT